MPHRPEVDEGRQQGNQQQHLAGEELGRDEFAIRDGLSEQQFDGARLALFGEHSHRNGGNQNQEEHRGDVEEILEGGTSGFDDIPSEHPYEKARQHKEHPDNDVAQDGGEKGFNLF